MKTRLSLRPANTTISAGIFIIFLFLGLCCSCSIGSAQTSVNFSPADKFNIPVSNGTINFGVNGSYSTATLQGSVWTFTDLLLDGSVPLATLKISTENSNLTIIYYHTRIGTSTVIPNESFNYIIVGEGTVTVNLGYSNAGQYSGSDWYVSKASGNGITRYFFTLGRDYVMGNDGTFSIYKITGNITVTHVMLSSFAGNNSNLPFLQRHSVVIAAAIVLVLTITVCVVIKLKNKPDKETLKENGGDA